MFYFSSHFYLFLLYFFFLHYGCIMASLLVLVQLEWCLKQRAGTKNINKTTSFVDFGWPRVQWLSFDGSRSERFALRTIVGCILLIALMIGNAYSGGLASIMTIPQWVLNNILYIFTYSVFSKRKPTRLKKRKIRWKTVKLFYCQSDHIVCTKIYKFNVLFPLFLTKSLVEPLTSMNFSVNHLAPPSK